MKIIEIRPILGDRVDHAYRTGEPTVITKNAKPRAVLISYADWQELEGYRNAASEAGQ